MNVDPFASLILVQHPSHLNVFDSAFLVIKVVYDPSKVHLEETRYIIMELIKLA